MKESALYDLLDGEFLEKWKESIEKAKCEDWFFIREQKALKELETELNEKNRKLLSSYSLAVEDRIDNIYCDLNIKILNFGVKIGMELQRAFIEFEE